MKDLERYLKETPKPQLSPKQFRQDLRRQLMTPKPPQRPWILKAEFAWLACLATAGILVLLVWQPQLANRAHALVFGKKAQVEMSPSPFDLDPSTTALASSEADRKLFESWALAQGWDKAPEIKNQETERLLLRRYVLQDGRMVEVVSRQNDDEVKQQNVLY
ncbi:MAG: hypothetical protein H6510_09870 [Acidobacteria bacterium]|nr:hypothetical protein [Acidobacteriota bacterium]MCB9398114.1 hypothetical protein [Acidobacteriota bacterium]